MLPKKTAHGLPLFIVALMLSLVLYCASLKSSQAETATPAAAAPVNWSEAYPTTGAGTIPPGATVVLDTDLLSTTVYAEHYYGACPAWIGEALERRAADLYLLAGIDVPWVAEVGQRDRGERREEMQALFRDALVRRALRFVEISGTHEKRMRRAIAAIDELL